MAEIAFVSQEDAVMDAVLMVAGPMATGDSTLPLTINEGNSDVSVHVYGTIGGSTVAITGSLNGSQFGVLDDAYGSQLSFTTAGLIKPVGPAVQAIKGTVTGGSGVVVFIAVYVVKGRK